MRIILWVLSLYLLAIGFALSGEIAPANPGKGSPSKPAHAFQTVELLPLTGKLVQDVDQISKNLHRICKAPKNLDRGETIKQLRDQLAALDGWDGAIRKLGATPVDKLARYSVYRDRAKGFADAWMAFSQLIIEASCLGTDSTHRKDLLTLDRPAGKESPLALLLTIHSQARAAERDKPALLKVGDPGDVPPKTPGEILSLWALVNLQLDTWHGRDKPDGRLDLARLATWLRQLHDDKNLPAFDLGADARYGQALKKRLERIQKFVAFRDVCGKDDVLHALVIELKNARLAGKSPAVVETPKLMQDLIDACKPIDSESLPQAEIWLRYVLLLSYQGDGVDAVAGTRSDVKGAGEFYKSTGLDKPFFDVSVHSKAAETSPAFLRWNKWPAKGHFIRTVFDAAAAAYRYAVWEAKLPEMEKRRYQSLSGPAERHAYAAALERLVDEGRALERTHLAPYLDAQANRADPYGFRPKLHPAEAIASATASRAERDRLDDDLKALTTQISAAVRAQELALLAERTDDPTAIAIAMQGMAGYAGVSRWNANALPTKTFADCARDVKNAAQRFQEDLKSFQYRQDLRERFAAQKSQTKVLELELAAERLGLEIAKHGKRIEETFKEIAKRDVEIRKLEAGARKLLAVAATDKKKAAELRLTLANQARDLAAAQVEALQQATMQAKIMVDQAIDSLHAMQPKLLEAAQKIEDSKKKSGFLSILKAVVNIVGAALGPFTGGASLAAAQAVNTAISIYEKASTLDLSNVESIAAGLAGIVNDVGTLADLSINKLGIAGESGKKALADVKGWIKTAEGDAKRLSDKAGKFLDDLKKLEGLKQSKLGQIASALASDIPVSIENGALKVDLGKAGIRLKDKGKELEKIWSNILDNGGMMVNDMRVRAGLAKLNLLPDDETYRAQLRQAVDELIRVCPEAMLLDRDVKAAARRVEESKARLKAFIDRASAEQRRFLGKLLDGWIVVKDGEGVVAVERSAAKESAEFKERVQHYINQVKTGRLEKLRKEIEAENKTVDELANDAAKKKSEMDLRNIANQVVPKVIKDLPEKLEALRSELVEARGKFKDAEIGVEIAAADDRAAKAMKEASELEVQVGELAIRKSLLGQTLAALKIRRAELRIDREVYRLQAAVRRTELAQATLRRIYITCRRWGVIPDQETNDSLPRLSLNGVLAPYYDAKNPEAPYRTIRGRLRLDDMAGDLVGMLQWLRLLNVTPKQKDPDKDRYVFERFTAILALLSGTKRPEKVAEEMAAIASKMESDFVKELTIPVENLLYVRGRAKAETIRWFDGKPAPKEQLSKDAVLQELPEKLRPRVICYFRIRVTLDPKANDTNSSEFSGVHKVSDPSASYYFYFKDRSLVRERRPGEHALPIDNLRYYIVSDPNGIPNPGLPLSASPKRNPPQGEGMQPLDHLMEKHSLDKIAYELKLWQGIHLVPALGDWTIFLLESTDLDEDRRQQRIRECRERLFLTLRIPYLQVPGAGRPNVR